MFFRIMVAGFYALLMLPSLKVLADSELIDIDKVVSVADLHADLYALVEGYYSLHPAPHHNLDAIELNNTVKKIKSQLTKPMTVKEAWRLFSLINPVLHDGHAGIAIPRRKSLIEKELSQGKRVFPLHVYLDLNNRLFLRKDFHGSSFLPSGIEILSINGKTSKEIIKEMLLRRSGDNVEQQRELISRWFSEEYWSNFDAAPNYEIEYLENDIRHTVNIQGSDTLMDKKLSQRSFDSLYSYKLLNDSTGYIRIETMNKKFFKEFLAMTETAFEYFKKQNVSDLVIDISDNGGGGNSMWQKGIMPYIAHTPYRYSSAYKARVTKEIASADDVIGMRVSGDIEMTEPDLTNPLKFKGNVYILVGSMTYSSAIHFAIAVQDHGIGSIIGTPTAGRSGTTGLVTDIKLKATGLDAYAPVVLYSRPSNKNNMLSVQPDIFIPFDAIHSYDLDKVFANKAISLLAND